MANQVANAEDGSGLEDSLRKAARAGAAIALAIGVAIVAGWLLRLDWLKTLGVGQRPAKFNAAIGLVLLNASLLLQMTRGRLARFAAPALAATAALLGAVTLVEYLSGVDLRIDQALIRDPVFALPEGAPGRMAANVALLLLLLGLGLLWLPTRRVGLSQVLAMGGLLMALVAIMGYLHGPESYFALAFHTALSIHMACALAVTSSAMLLARSEAGWVAPFSRRNAGGALLRRLVPAATLAPVGFDLVGYLEGELGVAEQTYLALDGLLTIVALGVIAILSARMVERGEKALRASEARYRQLFENLQATELKVRQLNESLAQRAGELTVANKELEAFSYSVSHDLRAPLRSIDGFSQALLEDQGDRLDAQGREHLGRVRKASQRMAHLIDDLLNLSRLSRAPMVRSQVDLSALARELIEDLRHQFPDRRVEVHVEPGVVAEGDVRLLRVVLENLLGNAFKFTAHRDPGEIWFGQVASASGRQFFVRDNGAGFNMAYVGKLFAPFQRLHKVEEFSGTGIGLATVQRIVQRHGGRAWAEGIEGKGATFWFTVGTPEGGQ